MSYIKSLFKLTLLRFSWLRSLVLYGLIGIFGAAIDYSGFRTCTLYCIAPEIANIIGGICGFLFTFTVNTFFNFKKTTHLLFRFISYGLICAIGMLISTICISIFKACGNIYALKLILICIISLLQFALNRMITYRK